MIRGLGLLRPDDAVPRQRCRMATRRRTCPDIAGIGAHWSLLRAFQPGQQVDDEKEPLPPITPPRILVVRRLYFCLGMYFTPGSPSKSASIVQRIASNCRAVARMMLSANGSRSVTPR